MITGTNRHHGWTQKFVIKGATDDMKGYLRVSENEDGTLHGIQIDIHREGSFGKAFANAFAASMNIGLQNGATLKQYCDMFRHWKFEPSGMVLFSAAITEADSLIDYVMQELSAAYLKEL